MAATASRAAAIGDPGRLALAAAIEQRDLAEREHEATKAALQRASEMVRAAENRVEAASVAIAEARAGTTARMTAAASSGEPLGPDMAMRTARAEQIDAADAVEAAMAALALVEAGVADAQETHERASRRVDVAIRAIVGTQAPPLIDEVQAARVALAKATGRLRVIWQAGLEWNAVEQRQAIERQLNALTEEDKAAGQSFKDWIENLKTDADAAAPI